MAQEIVLPKRYIIVSSLVLNLNMTHYSCSYWSYKQTGNVNFLKLNINIAKLFNLTCYLLNIFMKIWKVIHLATMSQLNWWLELQKTIESHYKAAQVSLHIRVAAKMVKFSWTTENLKSIGQEKFTNKYQNSSLNVHLHRVPNPVTRLSHGFSHDFPPWSSSYHGSCIQSCHTRKSSL